VLSQIALDPPEHLERDIPVASGDLRGRNAHNRQRDDRRQAQDEDSTVP
jgi:hypothetical protein